MLDPNSLEITKWWIDEYPNLSPINAMVMYAYNRKLNEYFSDLDFYTLTLCSPHDWHIDVNLFVYNIEDKWKVIRPFKLPSDHDIELTNYLLENIGYLNHNQETLIRGLYSDLYHLENDHIDFEDIFSGFSIKWADSFLEKQFVRGAVTFFDFLGWKGIWGNPTKVNNNPLLDISALVDDLDDFLKQETYNAFNVPYRFSLKRSVYEKYLDFMFSQMNNDDVLNELFHNVEKVDNYKGHRELTSFTLEDANNFFIPYSKLISISDTIVIFTPQTRHVSEFDLIKLHAKIANEFLRNSIIKGYPIRGSIGFGEYNFFDNMIIGSAIDECANYSEITDWIGVHLTPNAQRIVDRATLSGNSLQDGFIAKYDNIPFKQNYSNINLSYCVDWYVPIRTLHKARGKAKNLPSYVLDKYINTQKFFERIR